MGIVSYVLSTYEMRIDACLLKLDIKSAIDRIFCNRWFGLYRLFLFKCMPFPNRNRYRVRTGVKWKLTDRAFIHSLRKIMSVNFFTLFLDTFLNFLTFWGVRRGTLGDTFAQNIPSGMIFPVQKKFPWHALLWICHGKNRSHPPKNALYHTVQMVLVDPCDKLIICFLWVLKSG